MSAIAGVPVVYTGLKWKRDTAEIRAMSLVAYEYILPEFNTTVH